MKSVFLFSVVAAAAICFGEAVTLTSQNVVGIQRTTLTTSESTVTQPFVGYSATGSDQVATLADLVYTDNLNLLDEVMVRQNSEGKYWDTWVWLPGLFTTLYPSARDNVSAPEANTELVPRGVAVSVRLQNVNKPVYLVGQVLTNAAEKTTLTLNTGYTSIVNPLNTELDLDQLLTASAGVWRTDQILITDSTGKTTAYYYLGNSDGQGRYWYYTREEEGDKAIVFPGLKIGPGESFTYRRRKPESLKIQL